MRTLVFIWILLGVLDGYTQDKKNLKTSSADKRVEYIGSSEVKGRSDAVIVDEANPLIHTKQFLPLTADGVLSGEGDLRKQVGQLFQNIAQALKPANAGVSQIIKLNIFLKSADLISETQALISRKFSAGKQPSISMVAGDLAHPGALISMDAIAISGLDEAQISELSTSPAGKEVAILPVGPVVYVSGQAAKGGLAEATRNTLLQLNETLTFLGLGKKDIIQVKSFLSPMSSLSIVEKEFSEFFKGQAAPPLVFVDWISNDPVIEIELIASSPIPPVKAAAQIEYLTPPGMTHSPVYSKVTRLNYGKKVYLSGIYGQKASNSNTEVTQIFKSMGEILTSSGSDFNHLLKATYYINSDQHSKSLGDLRPKYYDPARPPAASKAMVKGIGLNGAGISIDMIGTIRK